jgi:tetratricopeptide (TPR) repeat protein
VDHNPRIEDLRRRVERDPASIAFAQLAEEYRRAGDLEEAIRVCEAGLAQHPAYISARVTLGRALFELGRLEEARVEFARVLGAAPDNLTARSKLTEIDQRTRPMSPQGTTERRGAPPTHSAPDPVLTELHAWLDVIAERRLGRRS